MKQLIVLEHDVANNRLLAIVTILVLVGSSGAAQEEPSIEELLTIEKLIDQGEWRALYYYLAANPGLTTGNSPLAVELRSFVDDAKRGRLVGFDADLAGRTRGTVEPVTNAVEPVIRAAEPPTGTNAQIY
jgi:hypothetical protein